MAAFTADPTDLLRSRADRYEQGRQRRQHVPRAAHADHLTTPDRPDPVALLAEQHAARLPDLIPVRWGRMAQSPFAFLRGAALTMLDDLARTPTTGLTVQACGDAHLRNFGGFASPERLEVFDLNDFDETLTGPWEWDVKRLAASAAVAAHDQGLGDKVARAAARAAVGAYRDGMTVAASMTVLEVWYLQADLERTILPQLKGQGRVEAKTAIKKMERRTSEQELPKLTELTSEGRRIIERPPLITRLGAAERDNAQVMALVDRYVQSLPEERQVLLRRFAPIDAARKVVGVGSVGTRCYIVLCMAADAEPLFLQVKEALPSVLERACGPYDGAGGKRVVTGQRQIQAASDIFLGWTEMPGHDFYVRQLRDRKYSVDITTLPPDRFESYLRVCGLALARAHARTGDPVAIAGYLGTGDAFVDAVTAWSLAYADQTRRDHARLLQAIADGEVEAVSGV